jgi:hypothetical protein
MSADVALAVGRFLALLVALLLLVAVAVWPRHE